MWRDQNVSTLLASAHSSATSVGLVNLAGRSARCSLVTPRATAQGAQMYMGTRRSTRGGSSSLSGG